MPSAKFISDQFMYPGTWYLLHKARKAKKEVEESSC